MCYNSVDVNKLTSYYEKCGESMPVVDLFCGCGGLSKGFELAGFDIVAAFDSWQSALTCYNANFNHDAHFLDLNDVAGSVAAIMPYAPTIIIGGPPCQEFSNAGKRQEGPLADLTYKYAQIIAAIRPQYFVMENVPRAKESQAYSRARALYKNSNYGLTEVVLDASRCGVPQHRNRFFCIGALNAPDGFLAEDIFCHYIGKEITVADYFANNNIPLDVDAYYRHPTTYNRRAIFGTNEVAPTIRGVNRPKPATYNHHDNDAVPEDQMDGITKLTPRQRATIQTFPQNYQFENLQLSGCDLEQMIGNAVPVELAHFVADRLQNFIHTIANGGGVVNEPQNFSEWLKTQKGYSDRSIGDVYSRLNRAQNLLPDHEINQYLITDLEQLQEFNRLAVDVKSQIRKAIRLKLAYQNEIIHAP